VAGRVLDVPQAHPGVQRSGHERMPEAVRAQRSAPATSAARARRRTMRKAAGSSRRRPVAVVNSAPAVRPAR
jgi:hypothetical protein